MKEEQKKIRKIGVRELVKIQPSNNKPVTQFKATQRMYKVNKKKFGNRLPGLRWLLKACCKFTGFSLGRFSSESAKFEHELERDMIEKDIE